MPLFILLTCLVCIREGTSNQILGREIGTCHCVARWPNQWLLSRETPFSNVPPSNSCVLVSKGFSSWHRGLQVILVRYFWSCRDTITYSCVAASRRSQDSVKNNWHKPWFCVYVKHSPVFIDSKIWGWPPCPSQSVYPPPPPICLLLLRASSYSRSLRHGQNTAFLSDSNRFSMFSFLYIEENCYKVKRLLG